MGRSFLLAGWRLLQVRLGDFDCRYQQVRVRDPRMWRKMSIVRLSTAIDGLTGFQEESVIALLLSIIHLLNIRVDHVRKDLNIIDYLYTQSQLHFNAPRTIALPITRLNFPGVSAPKLGTNIPRVFPSW